MKKAQLLVIKIFICLASFSQNLSEEEKRDIAKDLFADVLFDTKSKLLQDQRKAFENQHGVKLQFKVEEASLDQLGGLSEHILKLFQNITLPANTNAKTITAEFSALQNEMLSEKLSYQTRATPDLRQCRLPEEKTDALDSLYNANISRSISGNVQETNYVPAQLDDLYNNATTDYGNILYRQAAECPETFDAQNYAQLVQETTALRSQRWLSDASFIRNNVSTRFSNLLNEEFATAVPTQNNMGIKLHISPESFNGEYIVVLNNSINECTRRDMEMRSRLLFTKTGIHYLFVTATLPYFIPRDSLDTFTEEVLKPFIENHHDKKLIVALYLEFSTSAATKIALQVKQSGEWLSKGDIDFARYNNGGNYRSGTYAKYGNLFRNIPKPLIMCYQVAKVSGYMTTSFVERAASVKGAEQIIYHSFMIDEAFEEIAELQSQLTNFQNSGDANDPNAAYNATRLAELRNKIKTVYIKAAQNPKLKQADICFKEHYLQTEKGAEAHALVYLDEKYPTYFKSPAAKQIIETHNLPTDIKAGTCTNSDASDAIGNVLGISSLLLSPAGLDIIPDALSVIYFYATDNDLEFGLSAISVVTPANINALKRGLNGASDAVAAINRGEELMKEGAQLSAIKQEVNQVASVFKISSSEFDAAFTEKIINKVTETKSLLTTNPTKAKIYSHVSEKLEPAKRKEFVYKFLDEADFRNKVLADPDEVLRWGGVIRFIDDFIPSSGFPINGNINKTTTLLGRWNPDMQVIKGKMLSKDFNVGTAFGTLPMNKGGFNFLNIADDLANASEDFFAQYNKPWLETAIERGDDIILATKPSFKSDFVNPTTGALKGAFAEELKFLVQKNYKPKSLTNLEWDLIKTWFQ